MRVVLDASVFVAANRLDEPLHLAALAALRPILARRHTLIVPALFPIEVTSALVRQGLAADRVSRLVARFMPFADEVATLGPKRAEKVAALAASTKLRAADAIYVWLAAERRATLITADVEVIERALDVCKVISP